MARCRALLLVGLLATCSTAQQIPSPSSSPAPAGPQANPPTPASPAATPSPAADSKPVRAQFYFLDRTKSTVRFERDRKAIIRGKALMVVAEDHLIAYCDAIDYAGDTTGIATVTGNLRILSGDIVGSGPKSTIPKPEQEVTGAIAWIFTKEKRAVVDGDTGNKTTGKVVLVNTPQEQAAEDADRFEQARYMPTTMRCDRLTYWYKRGDRKAVCAPKEPNKTINFSQDKQRGTAGRATYYEIPASRADSGDIVDLEGGLLIVTDDGESVTAGAARFFIDQDASEWFEVAGLIINLPEDTDIGTGRNEEPAPAPADTGGPLPAPPEGQETPAPPPAPPTEPSPGAQPPAPPAGAPAAEPPPTEPTEPAAPVPG